MAKTQTKKILSVHRATTCLGMLAVSQLLCAGASWAEEAPTPVAKSEPEAEIIVTAARQRSEDLQKTPVAVTALSSATLNRYQLTNLQQVANYVPGLSITATNAGAGAWIFLRGVGTPGFSAGFESAVGVVIDGQYYSRGRWIQQGYFDLAQIEVMKGPQALYYGKNNSAGLIVMTTKGPGDRLEANGKIGYEFVADEIAAEAGLSVPLSDTLAVRVAGRYAHNIGWLKNKAQPLVPSPDPLGFDIPGARNPRLGHMEEAAGRLTVKWEPTNNFNAQLKVAANDYKDDGPAQEQLVACFGAGGKPQPVFGVSSPFDDCKKDFNIALGDMSSALMAAEPARFSSGGRHPGDNFMSYKSQTASLQLNWDVGKVKLSSVTGWQHYLYRALANYTFANDAQVPDYSESPYTAWSQEVRALTDFDGPINFLVGGIYSGSKMRYFDSPRIAPLPADPVTGRLFSWDLSTRQSSESWSAFAEATWNIVPELELAAGARYSSDKKTGTVQLTYLHSFLSGIFTTAPLSNDFKADNLSPQATLTWRPTNDLTFYGAYKTGYKSGGIDVSTILVASTTPDDLIFKNEKGKGFELGAKMLFLNRRLKANFVVYDYKFTNLQVVQFNAETVTQNVTNAAKASTKGFEADVDFTVSDALSLRGTLAYNEGVYDEYVANCYAGQTVEAGCNTGAFVGGAFQGQQRAGQQLMNAPRWQAAAGFTYNQPINSSLKANLSVDGRYSSSYQTGLVGIPEALQPAYGALDATLNIGSEDDRWQLSFIGRNLTNHVIGAQGSDRPLLGSGSGTPAAAGLAQRADLFMAVQRARQLWVQLSFKY